LKFHPSTNEIFHILTVLRFVKDKTLSSQKDEVKTNHEIEPNFKKKSFEKNP